MAEIRTGFSWASLIAIALGIGIIAWLAFTATSKEDIENYKGGKSEYNITENNYPLALPRCGRLFDISGTAPQTTKTKVVK